MVLTARLSKLFVAAVIALVIFFFLYPPTSTPLEFLSFTYSTPAWQCTKPRWCDHVLVEVQTRNEEKDFGYAAWVNNMIAVIDILQLPIIFVDGQENRTGHQACAIFVHNLFPHRVEHLAPKSSDVKESHGRVDMWLGPFSLENVNKLNDTFGSSADLVTRMTKVHLLAESDGHVRRCEAANAPGRVECLLLPMGVSTSHYRPPRPDSKDRVLPVVYLKTYDNAIVPEEEIFQILANCSIFTYTVLRTERVGPRKFTKKQYFDALADAPWMLAFTPGDNLGTFLQEARAMDVPVFLIAGDRPKWFPPSAGEFASWTSNTRWDEHAASLRRFITEIAPTLHPREELLKTIAHEASAARLCTELQRSWNRTIVFKV